MLKPLPVALGFSLKVFLVASRKCVNILRREVVSLPVALEGSGPYAGFLSRPPEEEDALYCPAIVCSQNDFLAILLGHPRVFLVILRFLTCAKLVNTFSICDFWDFRHPLGTCPFCYINFCLFRTLKYCLILQR